jgi:hypothetical protein
VKGGLARSELQTRGTTYGRIEQTATDPEKDPGIDGQREAEAQRDEQDLLDVGRGSGRVGLVRRVCDLRARVGEEQEQERAHELAHHGHKVVAYSARHEA